MEQRLKHLDALDHNSEGGLLLGASSLTYRFWKGELLYFDSITAESIDLNKCAAMAPMESGVGDVKWIGQTKRLVAACDSGAVELWELSQERDSLSCIARPVEHDNIVSSVSVNATASKLVSASYDRCVSVWDIEEFIPIYRFKGHYSIVWAAACHPTNPDTFISCSQDGRLLVWDVRRAKPASLMENQFLPSLPTSVAWQPGAEYSVAIGTETGQILLQDCRMGVGTPIKASVHSRTVHRLAFAPNRGDLLASVSNDGTAAITKLGDSEATVLTKISEHKDFVQGLSWNPLNSVVYTCSWDGSLRCHSPMHVNGSIPGEQGDK